MDCLLFAGEITKDGYGRITDWNTRKHFAAHRIVYEQEIGKILDGLVIDHLCRVRRCINPRHMEQVPAEENIRRGVPKNRDKRVCDSGHLFDKENTRYLKNGKRQCIECQNRWRRESRLRYA